MNRFHALAALAALALSTLCACDPTQAMNHMVKGPDYAPPANVCPDGPPDKCPPRPSGPNTKH